MAPHGRGRSPRAVGRTRRSKSEHWKKLLPIDNLLERVQNLVDAQEFSAANRLLLAVLDVTPEMENQPLQAKILTRLGLLHRELGNLDQALAAFLLAYRLQPSPALKAYIAEQQRAP